MNDYSISMLDTSLFVTSQTCIMMMYVEKFARMSAHEMSCNVFFLIQCISGFLRFGLRCAAYLEMPVWQELKNV